MMRQEHFVNSVLQKISREFTGITARSLMTPCWHDVRASLQKRTHS